MFDLPSGFPLSDFEECSYFAYQMLLQQQHAEEYGVNPLVRSQSELDSGDDPVLLKYHNMQKEHGFDAAYYYRLTDGYQGHNDCQLEYRDLIVTCEGGSSNIAEFPSLAINGAEELVYSPCIGVTAHEAVYLYLSLVFEAVESWCFKSGEDNPDLDEIKKNIIKIKDASSTYRVEIFDAQRISCRINRELLLVCDRYESINKKKTITRSGICRLAAKAKQRERPYGKQYVSDLKKKHNDFPDPTTGGRNKGSGEATYDYDEVIKILNREIGEHNWDSMM